MSNPDKINIESSYIEYAAVIEKFTPQKIIERYARLLESANKFIKEMEFESYIVCNEEMLMYAVLGYFSDIMRLKKFANIERIHETKILAYESEWLLKRKILQIKNSDDSDLLEYPDKFAFCNEQFVFSQITLWIKKNDLINGTKTLNNPDLEYFTNMLFYHLKYRSCDAKTLELMLVAFTAGREYQNLISTKYK